MHSLKTITSIENWLQQDEDVFLSGPRLSLAVSLEAGWGMKLLWSQSRLKILADGERVYIQYLAFWSRRPSTSPLQHSWHPVASTHTGYCPPGITLIKAVVQLEVLNFRRINLWTLSGQLCLLFSDKCVISGTLPLVTSKGTETLEFLIVSELKYQ